MTIDTLIDAGWVLSLEDLSGGSKPLAGHSVAVHQGAIVEVLPTDQARARYSAQEIVHLPDHLLMPGLVNTHTHAAMTLLRGYADDLPLMSWLQDHIWPAETRFVAHDFVRDGARLACAEMLLSGITSFNDMYFFPAATAEAASEFGMRATIGLVAMELPTAWASTADEYLKKGLQCRDSWSRSAGRSDLVSFALAPHAPYTVGDGTFKKIAEISKAEKLQIHCHIHESQNEIRESLAQFGMRPLQRLSHLGVVTERLLGVHAVHLDEGDFGLLRDRGAHISHCPSSNLKISSGFAPIAELTRRGINVGLGTDGAASNNRLDLWTELRQAALNAKAVSGDPSAWPASQALYAATLGGAKAMGIGQLTGSITPGKRADLIAVDFSALELQPLYQPLSHLAYVVGREHVTDVWVDGQRRVAAKKLLGTDLSSLRHTTSEWVRKIRGGSVERGD